jgi:sterol desaturase/sphingolipid hydroxylase (fatty acid hydroxylase superfamily)
MDTQFLDNFLANLARVAGGMAAPYLLLSLPCALVAAVLFVGRARWRKGKSLRMKLALRALFPARYLRHASSRIDFAYYIFNTLVFGVAFGWTIVSYHYFADAAAAGLTALFGARPGGAPPDFTTRALVTLALFLAYELAYWVDHYLSHSVPFLWEFHKAHHTAEVLTPLTVFRVHPVDTMVFANITSLFIGAATGIMSYWLGGAAKEYVVTDTNLILMVFMCLYVHLQHSHLWIAFRGAAGRIFLSPAHHQLHHSTDPRHFNSNMGSCLAVFDWLFGTLNLPSAEPEKLTFGIEPRAADTHSLTAAFVMPIAQAWRHMAPGGREAAPPVVEPTSPR